jgi:predicted nucleic acid-binding protein
VYLLLLETQQMLGRFSVVVFDELCAEAMKHLQQQHRTRKRYADLMIAAMVITGGHILVTRNQADFVDLLPKAQLANWIDDYPT